MHQIIHYKDTFDSCPTIVLPRDCLFLRILLIFTHLCLTSFFVENTLLRGIDG